MGFISVVGNLTRDPETRQAGNSTVTKLSLADNYKVKGEKHTVYYNVSVWGKSGEAAEQHLSKGSSVFVNGELRLREYTNGAGEAKTSLEVENASWTFAGSSSNTGGGRSQDPEPTDESTMDW